ncbi:MAG: alpha-amylase family glycosyl hydrolase [Alphaproteobacteria bacterium]
MPGHRIYYVPPRMVGAVTDWSGKDQPGGASWLIDHVADLGLNAIWFSPMGQPTAVEKISHGQMRSGSYYAQRDHFRLGDEFSAGQGDEEDLKHLQHFAQKAKEKGVRLYADLVCNHVAADHPLVFEEDRAIADILKKTNGEVERIRGSKGKLIGLSWREDGEEKSFHLKFRRKDDFTLQLGGPAEDPWSDVAHINYSSPEAKRFFIFGDDKEEGYFKKVIDWSIKAGFTDFRCDAAYLIPPDCWQALINHAHAQKPDAVFMAETLTTEVEKVERLQKATITDANGKERPAFDLGMLGIYWWNFRDDWLPKSEVPRVNAMATFGGAGSPDNHDTENTIAGSARKAFNGAAQADRHIAEVSVRDYAVAVMTGNSSYVQMGYEFCNEKQNHVFKGQVTPQDFKDLEARRAGGDMDIRARMRGINDLHERMDVGNCRAVFRHHGAVGDGSILRLALDYVDVDSGAVKASAVLLMNRRPEAGPVKLPDTYIKEITDAGLGKAEAHKNSNEINDIVIFHTPLPPAAAIAPAAPRAAAARRPRP